MVFKQRVFDAGVIPAPASESITLAPRLVSVRANSNRQLRATASSAADDSWGAGINVLKLDLKALAKLRARRDEPSVAVACC